MRHFRSGHKRPGDDRADLKNYTKLLVPNTIFVVNYHVFVNFVYTTKLVLNLELLSIFKFGLLYARQCSPCFQNQRDSSQLSKRFGAVDG